jgi:hypothetical protein
MFGCRRFAADSGRSSGIIHIIHETGVIVKILAAFGAVKFVCFIKIEETARGKQSAVIQSAAASP